MLSKTLNLIFFLIGVCLAQTAIARASSGSPQTQNSHTQEDIEEMIVKAPKSKRDLLRAREFLSNQLIEKLNANATGDDVISCEMQNTTVNINKSRKKLLRVCASKGTHLARQKVIKSSYSKCGTPIGIMLSSKRDFTKGPEPLGSISANCSPHVHKHKMQKISRQQNTNIDERVKAVAQQDPEFIKLLIQAKQLKDAYDNFGNSN